RVCPRGQGGRGPGPSTPRLERLPARRRRPQPRHRAYVLAGAESRRDRARARRDVLGENRSCQRACFADLEQQSRSDHPPSARDAAAGDLSMAGERRGWRVARLWAETRSRLSADGNSRRQDSARSAPRRFAYRAAHHVRARREPAYRERNWARDSARASAPCRQGDRMRNWKYLMLPFCLWLVLPSLVLAQAPARDLRVGLLYGGLTEAMPSRIDAVTKGVRETFRSEGRRVEILPRAAEGDPPRLP